MRSWWGSKLTNLSYIISPKISEQINIFSYKRLLNVINDYFKVNHFMDTKDTRIYTFIQLFYNNYNIKDKKKTPFLLFKILIFIKNICSISEMYHFLGIINNYINNIYRTEPQ